MRIESGATASWPGALSPVALPVIVASGATLPLALAANCSIELLDWFAT
jgi:hypothetical protein